jgi:hypothetical protein
MTDRLDRDSVRQLYEQHARGLLAYEMLKNSHVAALAVGVVDRASSHREKVARRAGCGFYRTEDPSPAPSGHPLPVAEGMSYASGTPFARSRIFSSVSFGFSNKSTNFSSSDVMNLNRLKGCPSSLSRFR